MFNRIKLPDVAFSVGSETLSPLISLFTQWLSLRVEENDDQVVLFFSRDANLLFEASIKLKALTVPSSYFYVSRQVLHQAANYTCSASELSYVFIKDPVVTITIVLKRLGLGKEYRQTLLKDCGLSLSKDDLSDEEVEVVKRYVYTNSKLHKVILGSSGKLRRLFIRYLQQCGVSSEVRRIGIVDLGWFGNIQHSFNKILQREFSSVRVNGYYLGLFSERPEGSSKFYSFLFGPESGSRLLGGWGLCTGIFEAILSADYGSTQNYKISGDKVMPVLSSDTNASYDAVFGEKIKEGLLSNLTFDNKLSANGFDDTCVGDLAQDIKQKFTKPSKSLALLLSKYEFSSDQTESTSIPLCRRFGFFDMFRYIFSDDRGRLVMGAWRGGCLVLSYPWAYIYILMRKIKGKSAWE